MGINVMAVMALEVLLLLLLLAAGLRALMVMSIMPMLYRTAWMALLMTAIKEIDDGDFTVKLIIVLRASFLHALKSGYVRSTAEP